MADVLVHGGQLDHMLNSVSEHFVNSGTTG